MLPVYGEKNDEHAHAIEDFSGSWPGAMIHTTIAVVNVPSIGRARYFATFINEECGHVGAFHMKLEGEETELLKRQANWIERQYVCRVKKLELDGGRRYVKGSKDLEVCGIEIHSTVLYMPLKNGRA